MSNANALNQQQFRHAIIDRAIALFHNGELHGAKLLLDQAAKSSGRDAFLQHMRGLVAAHMGHKERAREFLAIAIRLNPTDATTHANLGTLLLKEQLYSSAAAAFEAALSLQPHHTAALNGIAKTLVELGLFDLAADAHRDALACTSDDSRLQADLAVLLNERGDTDAALELLKDALSRDADRADIHTTLAFCLFAAGEWSQAWRAYEWRQRDPLYHQPPATIYSPEWQGEDLTGKTILLQAEQGFGDTIQFVRYTSFVKAKGCRVLLQAPKALLSLLANVSGIDQLISDDDPCPACDFHVSLMSLPGRFDTSITTVPADIPYLSADVALVAAWRKRLALKPGLAIGIAWQGNPDHPFDRWRSMPLSAMRPLFDCPGVQFVSLQFGAGQGQLKTVDASIAAPAIEHEITSFADTAAIIANLDLVISVDSSVAHLAGALGKPVWILLAARCDWRWMRERNDTPWYPQARLFRQETLHDWPAVIARVQHALWTFAGTEPSSAVAAPPQRRESDAVLADALFMQGSRLYAARETERAKNTFERALTFDPDHVNTLCNLAALEQASGNRERTMELLQRAIQLSPHHPAVRSVVGDELLALGPTDDAIALCQHMLQIMPDSAKVHAAYALALKRTNDLDRAMTHFKRAVELDQRQPATFYQALGETLIARGNLEGAEISLQHALALDPSLASAHCALAETYLTQGRPDDAASSFRAAIDIDPDHTDAIKGLEHIDAHRPAAETIACAVAESTVDRQAAEDRHHAE
ncbi:tetratricopeptide repeat protein [Microbacteriaceae bacterium K1510]|nr:tetratricopeptide repeat protein [Microbacteriaceae bacterium K1510]